jgi:hypothetical protein
MTRFHGHGYLFKRVRICGEAAVALAVLFLTLTAMPALAQTPTPWPSPTPLVTAEYVIHQHVSYGEGGIIVAALFLCGLVLLDIMLHLGERITDR